MEPRGKGRARGRARGAVQQGGQQGPRPGPARGPAGPPPQAPGQQVPWGRPPAPQAQPPPVQAAPGWVRPQMQAPPAPLVGRGSRQGAGGGGDTEAIVEQQRVLQGAAEGSGTQDKSRGAGNGGVRGRTTIRGEITRTRPATLESKQGSSGQQIQLSANYFALIQAGKWSLNQYRVDFNPEIDHTGQKKALLRTGLQNVQILGYLFDGTVLYTTTRIQPDPLEVFVQTANGENVRITIRLVGDVAWTDNHYIQLFNIIIRKCLTYMQFQLVGRNYFDPNARISLPEHKMELWPGYYTSMRQHERDILMNCDVQFKVMRMDNVYDMLLECRGANMRKEFQSKIIGSIVLTYYNNKTYRIDDVDFSKTPESTFTMRDGSQMSFIQYCNQKYNINVQVKDQPMLVSRSKPREIRAGMPETVLLVPELCQLTGLTDRQRENFHLMRALADHTRVGPQGRIEKLMEFSRRMRNSQDCMNEIRRWDLNVADSLVRFTGRVLPPETIVGGNNAKYSAGNQADWTKELRALPMFVPGVMQKFAIICPSKFKGPCQEFVQCLQRSARGMSWDIGQPRIFDIPDDRSQTYLDQMENIITKNNPHMIMCVVPNASQDRYSAIKKKGCVDRGVPTQVILAKNLSSKGVMSIATKVAIQLNCKIGGAPWTVILPLSNLMIVGYDVCRDTANKGRSFGGMVASLDRQATRYYSYTTEHKFEEELSDNFAAFLLLACQRFKDTSGRYPERILIYRDGVGDGQLQYVYEHEVVNIKRKLTEEIYKNNDLKMAFIVVSKRINTRIFGERGNPPPGTVVDDVITLPERYDFFIVSQCVRQGSVAPTSYNVIEDTMGLPPDRMQILTYKLCHMYYNWSGTVRVPAPCQYAHKLAFLVAQSLHRPAHRALENVLYYL
ncbi:piwi-like protein Siwi [Anoplophora glabripennis]|uniref:Protein piwi n=1 Tax=Anoplophora glabripennis TaxID=217634 RepID=V5I9K0_ANOGL|nr:piwi-like protein Siwi [Anoplophora glabripennis]XP_018561762.1 piwi-like protein Siwi [Anoplophora glabripennis]